MAIPCWSEGGMLVTMLNFASHKILTTLDLNTALLFCKMCGRTAEARSAVFFSKGPALFDTMSRLVVNWKVNSLPQHQYRRKLEVGCRSWQEREVADKIEIYVAIWNNHLSHPTWLKLRLFCAGRGEGNQLDVSSPSGKKTPNTISI